jgi:hypothetical protein
MRRASDHPRNPNCRNPGCSITRDASCPTGDQHANRNRNAYSGSAYPNEYVYADSDAFAYPHQHADQDGDVNRNLDPPSDQYATANGDIHACSRYDCAQTHNCARGVSGPA